jgi:pyruvate/oxaloacetate carboxyltransferase
MLNICQTAKSYEFAHCCKFLLKESQWDTLDKLQNAMQPVKNLTLLLQRKNLLIGDFYGAWVKTKVKLKNINSV